MRPNWWLPVLGVALLAAALRLPRLDTRPMHADEAIQADKLGTLLETGSYRYDPHYHHGPTLNYLTLPVAWLFGARTYQDLNENILRLVPALLGLALCLMPFMLRDCLDNLESGVSAVLTALSPAMVYYSRCYIHETLLVCFTFGVITSGYLYFRHPRLLWAVMAGAFAGLMLATKETAIIALVSMGLALALSSVLTLKKINPGESPEDREGSCGNSQGGTLRQLFQFRHAVAFLLVILGIVTLFFSSFLQNPAGLKDFLLAYSTYFQRALHDPIHFHPWYYYLRLLLYFKEAPGPFWSEAFIVVLAVIGAWFAIRHRNGSTARILLTRFLLSYTALITMAYSIIPYKTPWCLLTFLHGMILLAGLGVAGLWAAFPSHQFHWGGGLLLGLFLVHLLQQSVLGSFRYSADPRNPYVYAQTGTDVFLIRDQVEGLAAGLSEKYQLRIQIISPKNLWPLPWYLRRFRHIEWWNQVPNQDPMAPVILVTPDMESALLRSLYEIPPPGRKELYLRLFKGTVELRPALEIRGYVAKSLWDRANHGRGD